MPLDKGAVTERRFEGRAVKHGNDGRYHCLKYPCNNLTRWVYIPHNSSLCMTHIRMYERQRERERAARQNVHL